MSYITLLTGPNPLSTTMPNSFYSPTHPVMANHSLTQSKSQPGNTGTTPQASPKELSINEKIKVQQLQQLDRSIKEHEAAHLRAARDIGISTPTYTFKQGPDGQSYAVSGEVSLDFSPVSGDAQATIEKARKIQNAALAPADPSPQDLQVAAQARIMENKAHRKIAREQFLTQNQKKDDQEVQNHPATRAYNLQLDHQKNLYTILDLFS